MLKECKNCNKEFEIKDSSELYKLMQDFCGRECFTSALKSGTLYANPYIPKKKRPKVPLPFRIITGRM